MGFLRKLSLSVDFWVNLSAKGFISRCKSLSACVLEGPMRVWALSKMSATDFRKSTSELRWELKIWPISISNPDFWEPDPAVISFIRVRFKCLQRVSAFVLECLQRLLTPWRSCLKFSVLNLRIWNLDLEFSNWPISMLILTDVQDKCIGHQPFSNRSY